jgi:hypothetical protein
MVEIVEVPESKRMRLSEFKSRWAGLFHHHTQASFRSSFVWLRLEDRRSKVENWMCCPLQQIYVPLCAAGAPKAGWQGRDFGLSKVALQMQAGVGAISSHLSKEGAAVWDVDNSSRTRQPP